MIEAKGWWYSPKKSDWVAGRSGHKHAKSGIDPIPELVIKSRLPEAGPFDPTRNEVVGTTRCPNDSQDNPERGRRSTQRRAQDVVNCRDTWSSRRG